MGFDLPIPSFKLPGIPDFISWVPSLPDFRENQSNFELNDSAWKGFTNELGIGNFYQTINTIFTGAAFTIATSVAPGFTSLFSLPLAILGGFSLVDQARAASDGNAAALGALFAVIGGAVLLPGASKKPGEILDAIKKALPKLRSSQTHPFEGPPFFLYLLRLLKTAGVPTETLHPFSSSLVHERTLDHNPIFNRFNYPLTDQDDEIGRLSQLVDSHQDGLQQAMEEQPLWSGAIGELLECIKFREANPGLPQASLDYWNSRITQGLKPATSPTVLLLGPGDSSSDYLHAFKLLRKMGDGGTIQAHDLKEIGPMGKFSQELRDSVHFHSDSDYLSIRDQDADLAVAFYPFVQEAQVMIHTKPETWNRLFQNGAIKKNGRLVLISDHLSYSYRDEAPDLSKDTALDWFSRGLDENGLTYTFPPIEHHHPFERGFEYSYQAPLVVIERKA